MGETRNQSNLNKDVIVSCMETDDGEKGEKTRHVQTTLIALL